MHQASLIHTSTAPGQAPTSDLVPTTEAVFREFSRFRVLVVGQVGSGKSSLIDRIFGTKVTEESQHTRGEATIEHAFESDANRRFVHHDSVGFEAGESEDFAKLKRFVNENSQGPDSERLHAIWLCVSIPYYGGRIFETGDALLLRLLSKFNQTPLIVVFTMLDKITFRLCCQGLEREPAMKIVQEMVEKMYRKQKCSTPFVCVSTAPEYTDTLKELTNITLEQLKSYFPSRYGLGSPKGLLFKFCNLVHQRLQRTPVHETDDEGQTSNQLEVLLATAQRINSPMKARTSIRIGKRKYWQNLLASAFFEGRRLEDCFRTIHQDIVVVWNFNHVVETYMLGDEFINIVSHMVDNISHETHDEANEIPSNTKQAGAEMAKIGTLHHVSLTVTGVPADAVLATWLWGVYQPRNSILRCMIGSAVGLVLIMETLFAIQSSIEDGGDRLHPTAALKVVEDYQKSDLKKAIHAEIRRFVESDASMACTDLDIVMGKITNLIVRYHKGGYERLRRWPEDMSSGG